MSPASSCQRGSVHSECSPPPSDFTERRVVRKLDFILLPFLSILFLLNSLDRSNIGNAETAHFTRDAGLAPEDLNVAVACFFAFFVALQPLGAAAGRNFGMARYVPSVMVLWGLLTICHMWVHRKWQLITIRILIGALEGESPIVWFIYLPFECRIKWCVWRARTCLRRFEMKPRA